jgi:Fic family protein
MDDEIKNSDTDFMVWKDIESVLAKYQGLHLDEAIDYKKFYLYSLITHSTAIEGSTLTEGETALLFDEGLVAGGKPLLHHLMNEDLKAAYEYALKEVCNPVILTSEFLQMLNAKVVKSTVGIHHGMGGSFDASKGEYRKVSVFAVGGDTYMNYTKVPQKVAELCTLINEKATTVVSLEDKYNLTFDAHLYLATIHPWVDGNGRTARLLMNYLQFCMELVPAKVFQDDRAGYIEALKQSQTEETNIPFRRFMGEQLLKTISVEIARYEKSQKRGDEWEMKM